jgi:hypothetical protein
VQGKRTSRREALIAALKKRLHRASRNQRLFATRWPVVLCVEKTGKCKQALATVDGIDMTDSTPVWRADKPWKQLPLLPPAAEPETKADGQQGSNFDAISVLDWQADTSRPY